jgi:hypothetical protein
MTTLTNIQQLENLFNDTTKAHCLEGFCFTLQHGMNFHFDDYEELTALLSEHELEIEFWLLDDKYKVDNFNDLEELLDFIECNDESDIDQAIAIKSEGYASDLDEALKWHEDNYFSESMGDTDLGYYMIESGLMGDIPTTLEYYLDYEKIGKEIRWDLVEIGDNFYWNR